MGAVPRFLLVQAGWSVDYADEHSERDGKMRFANAEGLSPAGRGPVAGDAEMRLAPAARPSAFPSPTHKARNRSRVPCRA
jgi:hypothetical protein